MKRLYFFLLLSLIIIILYIIYFVDIHYILKPIKNVDIEIHDKLYNALEELLKIFDDNEIEYIIIGGSLLGATREKKIILWDDDIDIVILNMHNEYLEIIEKGLKKSNYYIKQNMNYSTYIVEKHTDLHLIDLFLFEKAYDENEKKQIYRFKFPFNYKYPKEFFYNEELYPLKDYIFGKLVVKGPNNAVNYLDRTYGVDWNTNYKKWNSKTNLINILNFKNFTIFSNMINISNFLFNWAIF